MDGVQFRVNVGLGLVVTAVSQDVRKGAGPPVRVDDRSVGLVVAVSIDVSNLASACGSGPRFPRLVLVGDVGHVG